MSLIYKSIKKVRTEDEQRKMRPKPVTPEPVAPGLWLVARRLLVYVVVLLVFGLVAFYWLRYEINLITQATESQTQPTVVRTAPRQPVTPVVAPVGTPAPEPRAVVIRQETRRRAIQREAGIRPRPAPTRQQLSEPTQQLEEHFREQAVKNQEFVRLEKGLKQTTAETTAPPNLNVVAERLGKDSLFTLKWDGYKALRAGDYTTARRSYEAALERKPSDMDTKLNLALAYVGLEEWEEAYRLFRMLSKEYPTDEKVMSLGAVVEQNR